jgi:hypothetical protein
VICLLKKRSPFPAHTFELSPCRRSTGPAPGAVRRAASKAIRAAMRACCAQLAAAAAMPGDRTILAGGWQDSRAFHSASGRKSVDIHRCHWMRAGHRFSWAGR